MNGYRIIGGRPGYIGPTVGNGIFDRGHKMSSTWYEQLEPRTAWALERRPAVGLYGGTYMIGPAMGTDNGGEAGLFTRLGPYLAGAAVGLVGFLLFATLRGR